MGTNRTRIIKNSNATTGIQYFDVDCIIALIDDRYKNSSFTQDSPIDMCVRFIRINHISLGSSAGKYSYIPNLAYGIYTYAMSFCKFNDIAIQNCSKSFSVQYNCNYCEWNYCEANFANIGFDLDNLPAANTVLLFSNCHTNGCITISYKIKGRATLINCSNDGGTATFIRANISSSDLLDGYITVINAHTESPNANGLIYSTGGAVNVYDSTFQPN